MSERSDQKSSFVFGCVQYDGDSDLTLGSFFALLRDDEAYN